MSWSGAGFIFYFYYAFGTFGILALGFRVESRPLGALVDAGLFLLSGAIGSAVGRLMNRRRDRHEIMHTPVQYSGAFHAVFAWIAVSVAAGLGTSRWVGWVVFLAPLVIAPLVVLLLRGRRARPASRQTRDQFAATRRWSYLKQTAKLADRYRDSPEPSLGVDAFDVVFGSIDGIPFTAWDTRPAPAQPTGGRPVCRTTWALHLPASFPTVVHADGRLVSQDAALAAYLWSGPVAETTASFNLDGWFLYGPDLLFSREAPARPGQLTPLEVATVAAVLVRLVRAFPADLPDRFGAPAREQPPLRDVMPLFSGPAGASR